MEGCYGYDYISKRKLIWYRTSAKTTVRAENTEKTEFMSEDEKLEAFKKEIWKEIDAMPWNSCMNTSIQISDGAFKRMMIDEDFKNRMIKALRTEAVAETPAMPSGVTTLIWVDENGKKGFAYQDIDAGRKAFKTHSKHKDNFYVKKAKAKEVNDAWEQARIRREKQREVREEEYWSKYFANKAFMHQEQVASLYESSIPEVNTQDMTNMEPLAGVFG